MRGCVNAAIVLGFLCLCCAWRPAVAAPPKHAAGPLPKVVTIGVLVAPPFVMKDAHGHYMGIAIDLWRDVARDMNVEWKVHEYDLQGLLDALESGKVDVGVSALSITPEREFVMDFSQPFYYTGLGIAVPAKSSVDTIGLMLRSLLSSKVLLSIGSLLVLLLIVGTLVWVFERRCNPEQFRAGKRGIGDGLWWSGVTMTSVGYGDAAPKSVGGRILAMVWMFASVVLLASFTASVTSTLTLASMGSSVHNLQDLEKVPTGVLADSSGEEALSESHIGTVPFATAEEGLRALADGTLGAFVLDQPLLHYYAHRDFPGTIRVLPEFFFPQLYGFAFPRDSVLRKSVNVALLQRLEDRQYRLELFGPYLGKGAVH